MMFGGTRIIEDLRMLRETTEIDWSQCRSPSRAMRRKKLGHKQRDRFVMVPRMDAISIDGGLTLFMHPAAAKKLFEMAREPVGVMLGRPRLPIFENALWNTVA